MTLSILAPLASLLIIVISLVGIVPVYTALHSDDILISSDRQHLQAAIEVLHDRMAAEQDNALHRSLSALTATSIDATPIDATPGLLRALGAQLTAVERHDLVIAVADKDGVPVYASRGVPVTDAIAQRLVDTLAPRQQTLVNTSRRSRSQRRPTVDAPPQSFVEIAGRPALAVASRIPLDTGDDGLTVISIAFLDNTVLNFLRESASVEELSIASSDTLGDSNARLSLHDPAGHVVAVLRWHRQMPGHSLLKDRLLPYAVGAAMVVIALVLIILHAISQAVKRLRTNERLALRAAMTDALTGLINRTGYTKHLDQLLLDRATTPDAAGPGVAYIDIDQFKQYNDTLGHAVGDRIIIQVAERLVADFGEHDLTARIGADEFAVTVADATCEADMAAISREIVERLSAPIRIEDHVFRLSVSVGTAVAPTDGETAAELMRRADIALHNAKRDKSRPAMHFHPSMEENVRLRQEIVTDLRHAIANNELSLNYQPIMSPDGKSAVGVEALLRWNHPERGAVSPALFIPIAEEHRLIGDIDRWVFANACR